MCGRYSLTTPIDGIRALFGFSEIPNLPARYNIAPTQAVLSVYVPFSDHARREDPGYAAPMTGAEGGMPGTASDNVPPRHATLMRWGLIPSWAKEPSVGARMINARSETIREKPSFRASFIRRRCLLPADSFYEWKTVEGRKTAYRIFMEDGGVFAFAGVYDHWMAPDGSEVTSCSIVTTDAAANIAPIHHRMPVILDPDGFETWLTGTPDMAEKIMQPYEGARTLSAHAISSKVNNVRNDGPELWDQISDAPQEAAAPDAAKVAADPGDGKKKKDPDQLSLF